MATGGEEIWCVLLLPKYDAVAVVMGECAKIGEEIWCTESGIRGLDAVFGEEGKREEIC